MEKKISTFVRLTNFFTIKNLDGQTKNHNLIYLIISYINKRH